MMGGYDCMSDGSGHAVVRRCLSVPPCVCVRVCVRACVCVHVVVVILVWAERNVCCSLAEDNGESIIEQV
jgi:hypothetical protein